MRLDAEMALQEIEPVDVRQVLQGVVEIFQDLLSTDTRRLALEIAEAPQSSHPYIIMAHEARLGRVVTNLLDNALSFSPQGGQVTVRAHRRGGEIEITVDDEGPGMPPDKLEDIFSRFYSDRPQTHSTVGKDSGFEHLARYHYRLRRHHRGKGSGSSNGAMPSMAGEPAAFRDRRARALSAPASRYACPRRIWQPSKEHSLGDAAELVHGTCVALGSGAALLRGPSGSGKSDLALRFLFLARRGPAALEAPILVADDQVVLAREGTRLLARAAQTIRGKIEVRGVGIVEVKSLAEAELKLVVDLVWPQQVERLPKPTKRFRCWA